MPSFREGFEKQLIAEGQTDKLRVFREAADKLKGDWVASEIFAFDSEREYNNMPNNSAANNASGKWGRYIAGKKWEDA